MDSMKPGLFKAKENPGGELAAQGEPRDRRAFTLIELLVVNAIKQ
jgi:hypothetical protein